MLLLEAKVGVDANGAVRVQNTIADLAGRLNAGSQLGLIALNDKPHLLQPLIEISADNKRKLFAVVDNMPQQSSQIDTASALERAIYELRTNGRPSADRFIIILGDALIDSGDLQLNTELSRWMREELAAESSKAGIRIFWLTSSESADYRVIQSVTSKTGGDYYRAFDTNQQTAAIESILQFLKQQTTSSINEANSPTSGATPAESNSVIWFLNQPVSKVMTHPLFLISITSLTLLALISALILRRKQGTKEEINQSLSTPDASHAILRDSSRFTGMAEYDITEKRTFIGRLPREVTTSSCIIIINDPSIGRNHATIEYHNNGYWVYDSGTVNGTYINGGRVHEAIQLHNGDMLRFGRFEFDVKLPSTLDVENGNRDDYTKTKTMPSSHASTSKAPAEEDRTVLRSRNHH